MAVVSALIATEPLCFGADPRSDDAPTLGWWLGRCQARHEKAVVDDARTAGIGYYLPLVSRRVRSPSGKLRPVADVPLFDGYVFLASDPDDRISRFSLPHVAAVDRVADPARLVSELRSLDVLLRSHAPLEVGPALAPGSRVEVRHGPLAGCTGVLLRVGTRDRLYVDVATLGRVVSVELERWQVEAVA